MARDKRPKLTPITDDPIGYMSGWAASNLMTEFRLQENHHGCYRIGELSALSGRIRSRVNYDHMWECLDCRPFKEAKEGRRIVQGFGDQPMWVSVFKAHDRSRAVRTARDRGYGYVALPIGFGNEIVLLTTESMFEDGAGCQRVRDIEQFVKEAVMPLRWAGSLSSSRRFLPPARDHRYWEAHHPGTGRKCWHAHETKEDAKLCAIETGERLDGTPKGWYVRGCSEWRMLGRIGVTGDRLAELLHEVGISSWSNMSSDSRADLDPTYVEFGPIEWDDERFVILREKADWVTPAGFHPPPIEVTIRIDTDARRMTGIG